MKLKSFKTIQVLYVVVSVSSLLVACQSKTADPQGLMSGSWSSTVSVTKFNNEITNLSENYGVPQAQSVSFSKSAEATLLDFTY